MIPISVSTWIPAIPVLDPEAADVSFPRAIISQLILILDRRQTFSWPPSRNMITSLL